MNSKFGDDQITVNVALQFFLHCRFVCISDALSRDLGVMGSAGNCLGGLRGP